MVKIESRPLENKNFEYVFYVDFEGENIQENISDVLEANKNLFVKYKILGAYKKRETIQL
jgi:chorismate mutase/prephenate dehydratase